MFDTILADGLVLDGTGAPARRLDVGIRSDRIAAIGNLTGASADRRIDATDRIVAPGFVDIHTHSDFVLLVDGAAESQIRQGVTTEIVGQCGHSCAPWTGLAAGARFFGYREAGVDLNWRSFGEYLDRLEAAKPALNVAAFVGHGAIRDTAIDQGTPEVGAMVALAEAAFDEGAIGLSTGLEYWPGIEAPFDEIVSMAKVAAKRGGLYATHVRNRDLYCSQAFAEAIDTARLSGARTQISHIQPKFGAPPGAMADALTAIDAARQAGADVGFDVIPHEWSHTYVAAMLPPWAREGGTAATLARLRDADTRARMKINPAPIWRLVEARHWDRIVLLDSATNRDLVGRTFAEIGARRGVDPHDAAFDLLLEEGEGMAGLLWTSRNFEDADVCMCLRHPDGIAMSDTMALSPRGPLARAIGSLGGYGWTARLLGHYARDRAVLSLPDAVARITSKPADRAGLKDRGRLAVGMFADAVVFDPVKIADLATAADPRVHPAGIEAVLVNGRVAFAAGDGAGGARAGRVLRGGR
jgi:N-acyl-D-amino-acid deacylase